MKVGNGPCVESVRSWCVYVLYDIYFAMFLFLSPSLPTDTNRMVLKEGEMCYNKRMKHDTGSDVGE